MNKTIQIFLLFVCSWNFVAQTSFGYTTDDVDFTINWPGPKDFTITSKDGLNIDETLADPSKATGLDNSKGMFIMSADKEKYYCELPDEEAVLSESDAHQYEGPDEETLLKPLLKQKDCTIKLEIYWSYELCHGKHLRQFHEEKDKSGKSKLQEYFLGHYKNSPQTEDVGFDEPDKTVKKIPTKKVEGIEIPYYAMHYEDGTTCDVTGRPRRASIQYVCHTEGNGEIYEIKEVSSCEYETVVLTKLLCNHPSYRVKKAPVGLITCHSLEGAPNKPQALAVLEKEQQDWSDQPQIRMGSDFRITIRTKPTDEPPPAEESPMDKSRRSPEDSPLDKSRQAARDAIAHRKQQASLKSPDSNILKDFFRGDFCLIGGSGWWKHELCHLKKMIQFHEDRKMGTRDNIHLGKWDRNTHIQWLAMNPSKKLKADTNSRKVVSFYYASGDICDITKKPREVEVKMKCVESAEKQAITIYLLEHQTCQYTLVVESPYFCSVFPLMDEYGFLDDKDIESLP